MEKPDRLLTISEVVDRLRDAGIYRDDRSRRSSIQALIKDGVLEDHLVLGAGRQRGGKFDKRISAKAVEQFVAGRGEARDVTTPGSEAPSHGLSAVQELTARIDLLMQDKQAARETARKDLLAHENELYLLRQRILELEHHARVAEIEAASAAENLLDEAKTRRTLENVVTQLAGPRDVEDLLDRS